MKRTPLFLQVNQLKPLVSSYIDYKKCAYSIKRRLYKIDDCSKCMDCFSNEFLFKSLD